MGTKSKKGEKLGWEGVLIICTAVGSRSPCLLSSCSSWRSLCRWAAWSAPARLAFPAARGAVAHSRERPVHPECPVTGLGLASPPRPLPAASAGPCHTNEPLYRHSKPQTADILPVTSDPLRQRKWDREEAEPGSLVLVSVGGACAAKGFIVFSLVSNSSKI